MNSVIFVLGPWSSGTTAVTGFIARNGAWSCPPHFRVNDPRTPDTHESAPLRAMLAKLVRERTLEPTRPDYRQVFRDWFAPWLDTQRREARAQGHHPLVLKHALLPFFLDDIEALCQPRYCLVLRDLASIEATRRRRGWAAHFGEAGARRLYNHIFTDFVRCGRNSFALSYKRFRRDAATREDLVRYCGLNPSPAQRDAAERWVK